MLTGTRAFEGDNVSDCVAAILRAEPDWSALPDTTAPVVRKLLRRCLQKDPRQRFGDIRDARFEVVEALVPPELPLEVVQRRTSLSPVVAVPWALAAVFTAAVVWLATMPTRTSPVDRSVTRLDLNLPAGVELFTANGLPIALSQDGTRLAFVGVFGGLRQLYVRRLDRFETVPLRVTENPSTIFASPDGRALGFITADRTLKTVSLDDGLVSTIEHDADYPVGAAWGADDRITFGRAGALWQVPATGGRATQLTTLDPSKRELLHAWPAPIAGGKVLLFTSITGSSRDAAHIEAFSLATRQRRVLVESGRVPQYVPSGHLVFFRDGALLASPFDVDRLVITGPVVRVVENLAVDATMGAPISAVSAKGSLVYLPSGAGGTTRLVWVSRQGVEQPITETARRYQYPRLAPDGQRIVVTVDGDLWIWDIARKTLTRLTSEGTVGNSFPVWTADGKRILFRSSAGMQWIAADGSGHPQVIPGTIASADLPASVAPDRDTLAFVRQNPDTSGDIYMLSLRGASKPQPVVNTTAYEGGPQFSPDGRVLAYTSDESGQMEVYARPLPGPTGRRQVSTQGGTQPLWNRNGKEIFYRAGNKMMVVEVSGYPDLTLSQPRPLFDQRYVFQSLTVATYDVSTDGQRFLMLKDEAGAGRLNVVLHWLEELKQRVPVK
jgi:serine/threonine-protein kinase